MADLNWLNQFGEDEQTPKTGAAFSVPETQQKQPVNQDDLSWLDTFEKPQPHVTNVNIASESTTTPAMLAENMKTAERSGLPLQVVNEVPQTAKDKIAQDFIGGYSGLSKYYGADVDNAVISKNDHEALAGIEEELQPVTLDDGTTIPGYVAAMSRMETPESEREQQGFAGTRRSVQGIATFTEIERAREGDTVESVIQSARGGLSRGQDAVEGGKLYNELGNRMLFGGNTDEIQQQIDAFNRTAVRSISGKGWFESAAEMAPILWSGFKSGQATGVGAGIGGFLAGGLGGASAAYPVGVRIGMVGDIFAIERGLALQELLELKDVNGDPIEPLIANLGSLAVGSANSALEFVGLKQMAKLFPGSEKFIGRFTKNQVKKAIINPSVQQALRQVALKYAKGVGVESITEMAQEVTQIITSSAVKDLSGQVFEQENIVSGENVGRVLDAGEVAFKASVLLQVPGGVYSGVRDGMKAQAEANTAEAFTDQQQRINQKVVETETVKTSPVHMENFLNEHMGLKDQNAFIDGDVIIELDQKSPEVLDDIEAQTGLSRELMVQGARAGQATTINLGAFHARLSEETKTALFDHIKATPGGYSVSQVQEGLELSEAEFEEQYNGFVAENQAITDEMTRIENSAIAEGADPTVARQTAQVAARMAQSLASRGKDISTASILNKINIGFNQDGATTLYQQDSDTTKQDRRGSVQIFDDKYLVSLFEKANESTPFHELGHVFFNEMTGMVQSGVADESLRQDLDTTLKWLGVESIDQIGEEQQEQFARGFEAYLMDGKAPTAELIPAFQRFKKWLKNVYKHISQLDVKLSPEIREVFDRMLTVESKIDASVSDAGINMMSESQMDALGVLPEDRDYLYRLHDGAQLEAERRMGAAIRREIKEKRAAWTEEAEKQADQNPLHALVQKLTKGQGIDREMSVNIWGEEVIARMPAGLKQMFRKDGMAPDILAAESGYESAEQMFDALEGYVTRKQEIRDYLADKKSELISRLDPSDFIFETNGFAEYLGVINNYTSGKMGESAKLDAQLAKKKGGAPTKTALARSAFRKYAQNIVQEMPVRNALRTDLFVGAMKKAAQAESRAIKKGDMAAARAANEQMRLNFEFSLESRRLNRSHQQKIKAVDRALKNKSMTQQSLDMVSDIAYRFGLSGRMTANEWSRHISDQGRTVDFEQWSQDMSEIGYNVEVPSIVSDRSRATNHKELSVEEFNAVTDTVKQIAKIDSSERTITINGKKQTVEKIVDDLTTQLEDVYDPKQRDRWKEAKSNLSKIKKLFSSGDASMTKMEFLFKVVDGRRLGVWFDTFIENVNQGDSAKSVANEKVLSELQKIQKKHYSDSEWGKMFRQRVRVKGVKNVFTKAQVLRIALDMGNDGNRTRRRDGDGWTDEQVAAIMETLTKKDLEYVQDVWDYIGSQGDAWFDLEERMTGRRPDKIIAQPVQTKHGEFRGGYFPVVIDQTASVVQAERIATEKTKMFSPNPASTTTKHGNLKARKGSAGGQPLSTEISDIGKHLLTMTHDIAFRERMVDIGKILRNDRFKSVVQERLGPDMYDAIVSWAKDIASPTYEPVGNIEKIAKRLRLGTTVMRLGKFSVGLQQAAGVLQTMAVLKQDSWRLVPVYARYAATGGHALVKDARFADASSQFMKGRIKSSSRELVDQFNGYTANTKNAKKAADFFMYLIGYLQKYTVDVATWHASYETEMSKSTDHDKAVRFADHIVRISQGSGRPQDLSRLQRSNSEIVKATTMFFSFLNTAYNLQMSGLRGSKKDYLDFLTVATLVGIIGPSLAEVLSGRPPDDDEMENIPKWMAKESLRFYGGMLPGVRDILNAGITGFDYTVSPVASPLESLATVVGTPIQVALGEKDLDEINKARLAKKGVDVLGAYFKLPTDQAWTTGEAIYRWMEDDPDFEVKHIVFRKQYEK